MMNIVIYVITALLEIGVGGFLCFRGIQKKNICAGFLGLVGAVVFASIALFVLCAWSYDEQFGIVIWILPFAVCGLVGGLAVWKYRAAMLAAAFAALFVICFTMMNVSYFLAVGLLIPGAGAAVVGSKHRYACAVLATVWGMWLLGAGFLTAFSFSGAEGSAVLVTVSSVSLYLLCAPIFFLRISPVMILVAAVGGAGVFVQMRQRKKEGEISGSWSESENAESGEEAESDSGKDSED